MAALANRDGTHAGVARQLLIGPVPTPKAHLADVIPIVRARPPKAS
jgi:hypothetical protein